MLLYDKIKYFIFYKFLQPEIKYCHSILYTNALYLISCLLNKNNKNITLIPSWLHHCSVNTNKTVNISFWHLPLISVTTQHSLVTTCSYGLLLQLLLVLLLFLVDLQRWKSVGSCDLYAREFIKKLKLNATFFIARMVNIFACHFFPVAV